MIVIYFASNVLQTGYSIQKLVLKVKLVFTLFAPIDETAAPLATHIAGNTRILTGTPVADSLLVSRLMMMQSAERREEKC